MYKIYKILCFIIIFNIVFVYAETNYSPATEPTPAIKKFQEAKFGIWCVITPFMPSEQLVEFQKKYPSKAWMQILFDKDIPIPLVAWNAEYNVQILKEAGFGYVYFYAKESDGFCGWKSKYTDCGLAKKVEIKYGGLGVKLMDVENGALANAIKTCHKHNMLAGLYYCYGKDEYHKKLSSDEYFTFAKNQVKELIDNYKPDMIMFSGVGENRHGYWDINTKILQDAYNIIKSTKSDCLLETHARYNIGTAYPTDIMENSGEIPSEEGYNPWQDYNGKKYYVLMDTFVNAWPGIPMDLVAIVCNEIANRGGNAVLVLFYSIDEQGKFTKGTLNMLKEFGDTLKKLKPNGHKKAVKKELYGEYIEASGKSEIEESLKSIFKETSQKEIVLKYKAILLAEKEMFEKVKLMLMEEKIDLETNAKLKEKINNEIEKADISDIKYSDNSCGITLSISKIKIKRSISER